MRTEAMIAFLLWVLLLLVCWPAAVLALVAYPLIWLFMLPLRLLGITADAALETWREVVTLPVRVLKRMG
jgi:ABC-type transport system involved in cytochrome bd biosynthesis fused ATPase/permease subunit